MESTGEANKIDNTVIKIIFIKFLFKTSLEIFPAEPQGVTEQSEYHWYIKYLFWS
jgi:hypothetical protein